MQNRKPNIIFVLLGFCMLSAGKTFSQPSDTIVIYEYIRIVDTIWIEREHPNLQKLPASGKMTMLCPAGSEDELCYGKIDVLSENQILIHEDQNQSVLEKKGFFTGLLWPFHLVASGKTSMNIYAGSSNMWFEHRTGTVNNPVWTGGHFGMEILFPLKNSRFQLSGGLAFHRVQNPDVYKQVRTVDASLPNWKYDYANLKTLIILNELNSGLFDHPYWQFSVPLKIHYRWSSALTPFAGVAYRYTRYLYVLPDNLSAWSAPSTPVASFNDVEILAGADVSIGRRMGLRLNVSNGLLGKHNHFENEISPLLGASEYYFKSLNVEVSLLFHLPLRKMERKVSRYSEN